MFCLNACVPVFNTNDPVWCILTRFEGRCWRVTSIFCVVIGGHLFQTINCVKSSLVSVIDSPLIYSVPSIHAYPLGWQLPRTFLCPYSGVAMCYGLTFYKLLDSVKSILLYCTIQKQVSFLFVLSHLLRSPHWKLVVFKWLTIFPCYDDGSLGVFCKWIKWWLVYSITAFIISHHYNK